MTETSGTFSFENDGVDVVGYRWLPAGRVKAAVTIAHGMAEHAGRYARFAAALNAAGYAVYAPDHRGHGRTAGDDALLGWAGPDGWNGMVRDCERVAALAREEQRGAPIFAFGHSMGSILTQRLIQVRGADFAGAILSGTTGSAPNLALAIPVAQVAALGPGARKPSALLKQMFADFNKPFAPQRTGFEWLSRDDAEVQKYVDDPRCGFAFSNRALVDTLKGWREVWKPENERLVPHRLPVLLFSGELDPVGRNTAGVTELADRYRALGVEDVRVVFYPGARHETLNESNREDVQRDVVAWLDEHLA
ncbi:MAG: alpha/beta hydrolase [Candidatus Elarobacter sp.]